MRAVQILVDGFAISSLYGLAAVGFTLIFGVSGVLNLAHGGIMVVAAAEVVVGLAIIMSIFRTRRSASVDDANLLKY